MCGEEQNVGSNSVGPIDTAPCRRTWANTLQNAGPCFVSNRFLAAAAAAAAVKTASSEAPESARAPRITTDDDHQRHNTNQLKAKSPF